MTPRWAAKIDDCQPAMVARLEAAGFGVRSLARMGGGWPDLIVWRHDVTWLVEVKGDAGKLTDDEHRWWLGYSGPGAIVRPQSLERWVSLARAWSEGNRQEVYGLSWQMRAEFVDGEMQGGTR